MGARNSIRIGSFRRFSPGAITAVLMGWMTLSAMAGEAIRMTSDKEEGVYGKGEVARVEISLSDPVFSGGEWVGKVSWQRSWSGAEEERDLTLSARPFTLTFADEEPGLVVVTVVLESLDDPSRSHTESIGMLFQPEAIQLSTPEPDDFDAFWAERKAIWRMLQEDVVLTQVDSPDPEIEVWNVVIEIRGKTPVSGYLAYSAGARKASLPAILTLHGAGFRSSNLGEVVRLARMGFLAMDINAHGLPQWKAGCFL